MAEVAGPVVAIALVLCAVFVPVAFLGGITGQLYRQFASTLSISVLLSALVALTLTPALCVMILRPRTRMRGPVGAGLRAFNAGFARLTAGYTTAVRWAIRGWPVTLAVLCAIGGLAVGLLRTLPTGSCRKRTRDTSLSLSSWRTARPWSVPIRWRGGPRISCARWRACRASSRRRGGTSSRTCTARTMPASS